VSIASEITRLQTAKADLKTAIEGKGVTVAASATLDDYADLVDAIETGGGGDSRLPAGYTEIESVIFNGTQYIDTGLAPVDGDKFELSIKSTNLTDTGDAIISAGTGTYQTIILLYAANSFYKYFASGTAKSISPKIEQDTVYNIYASTVFFCASATGVTSTTECNYGGAVNTNLFLGHRANASSPFHGHVYRFAVKNNGATKLNYVPCVRDVDSKVGFYDTVADAFVTSNSGNLVAGASLLTSYQAMEILFGE
jgi:hypothetical protein